MSDNQQAAIRNICGDYGNDPNRMMDIVREVQSQFGCVQGENLDVIAQATSTTRVAVEGVVTFYAFFSEKPEGKVIIRLCNDIIDQMQGFDRIATAFKDALGIGIGETTPDGMISLEATPCIGMSDQAPAALIDDVVFTNLTRDTVFDICEKLQHSVPASQIDGRYGDGNNSDPLVRSMVQNNIRKRGPVLFADLERGSAIRKAVAMTPAEVIRDVKTARLRGRGGAGFPTGMKWDFTRAARGAKKFVLCNADEGEPGTFKDRVILTECPDLLIEGMVIGGYAIGSDAGIIYLRGEYAYLQGFLEKTLQDWRNGGLLGQDICGKQGFNFDIRIQMGAGAYICGEETAMISSCEGLRGDPKTRPPFPAQKGYLGHPTDVNNVETFCCVARVLEKGPGWFAQIGSSGSAGTKLLSIAGDCHSPGVYEIPFGTPLSEVLEMAGGEKAIAVQVGGPSGCLVAPSEYSRKIDYDDLATGGSIMVFGPDRDILAVVDYFMEFFIEESCGYCTPCRVGNVLLKERLDAIRDGRGQPSDLVYLKNLGETVKTASRCGLGQTSPNPILTSLANFASVYEQKVKESTGEFQPTFDIRKALAPSREITGRDSVYYPA